MKRFVSWALLVVGLLAVCGGIWFWTLYHRAVDPENGASHEVHVFIPTGSDLETLVAELMRSGAVDDEAIFRQVASFRRFRTPKPGHYRIPPGMSVDELVLKLRAGEQDPVRFTFNNVRDIHHVAGKAAAQLEPDSMAFEHAFADTTLLRGSGITVEPLSLLFLPNTYELWWNTTPKTFLQRMAKEHTRFWNGKRNAKADSLGLSSYQITVLASIVEAETNKNSDAPLIAGVYLNRLRVGMPLQADPTLKFALGIDSVGRILNADKLVDSPYNTYRFAGLPPGPIGLPAPRYIDAVLFAKPHNYFYFCARADLSGYSEFSTNYEQHLVFARKYQRALDKRRILR